MSSTMLDDAKVMAGPGSMPPNPEHTTGNAPTDQAGERALSRARIMVLLFGFVVVGVAAGGIFDEWLWVIIVAPVAPTAAALVTLGRAVVVRMLGAVTAIGVSVALAVFVEGGTLSSFVDALTSGPQGLLSTDWPSPLRPELVGTVAAVLATATAVSDELAARRRFHLLPLLPLLLSYLGAVALSAPLGINWWWLGLLAATATAFATLRHSGTLHDRLLLVRGERRLVPLLGIAVVLIVLISIPISLTTRADPRRNDPPTQTAPLLDPVEASRALRNLDPPTDLHIIESTDGSVLPGQWRTAALSNYDGRRWTPNLTLRPIGSTLGPVAGPLVGADVSVLDDNLTLLPLPGPPVSVDVPVETDAERTVVRLEEPPDVGDVVSIVANVSPTITNAIETGVTARLVDDATSGFTELALGLAGGGAPLEQLAQLETTMRNEFVLDSNVQGGGLQLALVERFLRDTQRGTPEQFATGFTLLARSLGIEARVATGFRTESSAPDEPLVLRSDAAAVWPEVQLGDGRWFAFDPAPAEEATDGEPPPPEPQVQTPAAPQPPIAPPPDPDTETTEDDEAAATDDTDALSTAIRLATRAAAAITLLVMPFVIAAAVIVGLKFRRRRRRLRAGAPTERIRGAWASATDALVDAGLLIEVSATDAEIAERGEPIVANARRELHKLATLSSAATYGTPRHVDLLAEDASDCLTTVESSIGADRTRWQRMRWRLSLRSLRRSTRSPIDV